ncbi:tail fiber protein [Pectobacterium phage Phoria]|uniref:Tail fiber protein n=1 Tax=Pectobacterium phage Phoria TaxID=2489634 RepID=A0A3G8FJF2_9CAUD|nr:tail fiber protein [Pectobacterium phage Phoria]AZF94958.1 hypothetical protein [Pectobacterium phage Phoria]
MYSVQIAVSDGTLTRIALSIEYFEKDDITLYRSLELTPLVLGTDWQWDGDTHINLLTGIPVPVGSYITVRRNTDIDRAFNIYDGGAAFNRETLDENFKQMIYLAQEFTEGNGLTGLYFPLDMHGFQIKNLGEPTDPGDAVTKQYVDTANTAQNANFNASQQAQDQAVAASQAVQDNRLASLENTFVQATSSYPWYTVSTSTTDTFTPGFNFTKAAVYINGVCQTPDYSYIVVANQILLADPVPLGTMVFARLGEDIQNDDDFATTAQLSAVQANLQDEIDVTNTEVSNKASKGANSDISSLSGLTTPLSAAQGGTGNNTGNAATATVLATPRTIQTNLASTSAASFNGSANITPGVTGNLPVTNGGTGAGSAPSARANLGAAMNGINNDISNLAALTGGITGLTTGTAAASGIVGEVASAASSSATNLVSGSVINIISLSLPAGDWELESAFQIINTGNVTALAFGVSTTTGVLPTTWYDVYSITTTIGSGTSNRQGMARRVLLSTTTTVYLVAQATFTGTATANGYVRARRVR